MPLVPLLAGAAKLVGGAGLPSIITGARRILRGSPRPRALPPAGGMRPPPLPPMPRGGGRVGRVAGRAGQVAGAAATGSILYDVATRGGGAGGILPPVVEPTMVERIDCPPGYVAVDTDGDGVNDACMLKEYARKFGLWKSRPKPPVSGWDQRAIRRSAAAKKRVKKLAGAVGFTTTEKGRARRSSSGGKRCK